MAALHRWPSGTRAKPTTRTASAWQRGQRRRRVFCCRTTWPSSSMRRPRARYSSRLRQAAHRAEEQCPRPGRRCRKRGRRDGGRLDRPPPNPRLRQRSGRPTSSVHYHQESLVELRGSSNLPRAPQSNQALSACASLRCVSALCLTASEPGKTETEGNSAVFRHSRFYKQLSRTPSWRLDMNCTGVLVHVIEGRGVCAGLGHALRDRDP